MKERYMLLNLLAIIHRDGCHHTDEVGLDQSFREAKLISSQRIQCEEVVKQITKFRNDLLDGPEILVLDRDKEASILRRILEGEKVYE